MPGLAIETVSEDCLYLNIWAPAKNAAQKYPVMVWIYGGGDSSGSGAQQLYSGESLAQKGVVVVTFNYRVLAFGLLTHPDLTLESEHKFSGNYALLDDIAALQWVRANIAAFGGDPDNVTLFGQSAGAYHASRLMASPLAKGLFKRVIASSGGDFSPSGTKEGFPTLPQAEQAGVDYLARFGATSIAEMRRISADRIVAMDVANRNAGGVSGFNRANIDGYVVPKDVHQLFSEGQQTDVDVLLGFTADEGMNTVAPKDAKTFSDIVTNRFGVLSERALALFPASDSEAARSQVRMHTAEVAWRMTTWARMQTVSGKNGVFVFRFARVPPFQPYKNLRAAGHGAELSYVFGYPPGFAFFFLEAPWKAWRDAQLMDQIQTYWTNFAKTGDPNGKGLPTWPAFKEDQLLDFGAQTAAIPLPSRNEEQLFSDYFRAMSP